MTLGCSTPILGKEAGAIVVTFGEVLVILFQSKFGHIGGVVKKFAEDLVNCVLPRLSGLEFPNPSGWRMISRLIVVSATIIMASWVYLWDRERYFEHAWLVSSRSSCAHSFRRSCEFVSSNWRLHRARDAPP